MNRCWRINPAAERSLPSRERGLKFMVSYQVIAIRGRSLRGSVDWNSTGEHNSECGQCVAPFAGAWIEILLKQLTSGEKRSLPSRERGLKYQPWWRNWNRKRSLPSRERGLKFLLVTPTCSIACGRSLRGSVDWNILFFELYCLVAFSIFGFELQIFKWQT